MTLLLALTAALLISVALLYLRRRSNPLEQRRLHTLLALSGWLAAVAVIAALEVRPWFRKLTARPAVQSASAFLADVAVDPAAVRVLAAQLPQHEKPATDDARAWQQWQERVRGDLADRVFELDLTATTARLSDATLLRESTDGSLRHIELGIPAADGDSIPAVLLLPAEKVSVPGILFLPGHVDVGESGLQQLVADVNSYHKAAARELALAGYATLTIELRGFGVRGPPRFPEHRIVAYNALLAGGFYKKIVMRDIQRAFDLLRSVPEVDPERLGVSGASLGGELAVEYAALDTRVKAVAFHSHGGSVGPYDGLGTADAEQPHYCHDIPGVNNFVRQEDFFLLLAPRPTQGVRGEQQPFGDPAFVPTLQQVWRLMGNDAALDLRLASGETMNRGHVYYVADAVRFFDEHLR